MKSVIIVTINAPSRNDLKHAEDKFIQAIDTVRTNINDGAKVKRSVTNGDDPSALMELFGQLQWWHLGKRVSPTNDKKQPEKKQGTFRQLLGEIGKAAKSVYEDEIEI